MIFIAFLILSIVIYKLQKITNQYSLYTFLLSIFFLLISVFMFAVFPIRLTSVTAYNIVQLKLDPLLIVLKVWFQNQLSTDHFILIIQCAYSCFVGLMFSYSINSNHKHRHINYMLVAILVTVSFTIYSAPLYSFLISVEHQITFFNVININLFFDFTSDILRIVNMILLAIALINLGINIINQPDKGYYRSIAFYKLALASPFIIISLMLFFWSPAKLFDLTSTGRFFFLNTLLQERVLASGVILGLLPLIMILTIIFTLYLKRTVYKIDFKQLSISQSIHTAAMSIKVFNHSIKNHLLAIQYELETLKLSGLNDTESLECIHLIEKSLNHSLDTLNITKDMLNEYHPKKDFYSADLPITNAIQRFSTSPYQTQIHTEFPTIIPMIKMDLVAISETIYNLILNAIDAICTKKNGKITISMKEHLDWITIIISDNGCGIDPEDYESIFIPFKSTKSSTKNWGLGLSYCYKVVEAHKGSISVSSKPNEITQFSIRLPLR